MLEKLGHFHKAHRSSSLTLQQPFHDIVTNLTNNTVDKYPTTHTAHKPCKPLVLQHFPTWEG